MGWTKQQEKAINEPVKDILVSAAAGSGKTAVLVERIMSKVLDKDKPCDIDRFLVVTFTNAAAAQMKEKITAKLYEELDREPDNEHLMKQLVLINRANIMTIDSFCYAVVRENICLLDIDSDYSIGDTGLLELIKQEALDEALHDAYERENNLAFRRLLDCYAGDRNDDGVRALIEKVYRIADSFPEPEKWYEEAKRALSAGNEDEVKELKWVKEYIGYARGIVGDALKCALCLLPEIEAEAPYNTEVIKSDIEHLKRLIATTDLESFAAELGKGFATFKRMPKDYDKDTHDMLKDARDEYKKLFDKKSFPMAGYGDILSEIKILSETLLPLIELTADFAARFKEHKSKRRLMDFADVEHFALKLLREGYDEEGNPIPTAVGRSMSERFEEIYIDEYQDSNFLQEDILRSVSLEHTGKRNMFMVGDVKQSIYRFRLARPDIFMKKYAEFPDKDNSELIELSNNFRSRACVLESVNEVFEKLMHADVGGIEYEDKVRLVPTKVFPEYNDELLKSEFLIMDRAAVSEDTSEELVEMDKMKLEAAMIAQRINRLKEEEFLVTDEDTGELRPAMYGDMVILVRGMSGGLDEILVNTLADYGIPAVSADAGSYFEATEIRVIMSLLAVVDNREQDIPMAAVLLSPIGEVSEDELARIRYDEEDIKDISLFKRCLMYTEENDDFLSTKLSKLLDKMSRLRDMSKTESISSLVWEAYMLTGYRAYAAAMPLGEKRVANLDMLLVKAREFEKNGRQGLFEFLRYVDKLKTYEMSVAEARAVEPDSDVVRIMTMHKSKGLEFPIVFVSFLGKNFNKKSLQTNVLVDSDFFLTGKLMFEKGRYSKNSFFRNVMVKLMTEQMIAEELRVLYVAMTRAKEKLIMTGCEADLPDILEKSAGRKELLFTDRVNARSFLRMLLCVYGMGSKYTDIRIYTPGVLKLAEGSGSLKKDACLEELKAYAGTLDKSVVYDKIMKAHGFEYDYEQLVGIKSKLSITEIKKMREAYDETGEETELAPFVYQGTEDGVVGEAEEPDKVEALSSNSAGTLSASQRGTAVHRFMQLLGFKEACSAQDKYAYVRRFKEKLLASGTMTKEELDAVGNKRIIRLLEAPLAKRMAKAEEQGNLYKERQFYIGFSPEEIYGMDMKSDEKDMIMVQGIADAYFVEDGSIVLLDYKTDRADEEELLKRHSTQLEFYAKSLERLTGLKVKSRLIWSFYLGKEIETGD
ncbi:MAG: helicase-exonuclease AddAB subunit AddA [Lachnospiraceae bacterium]|nr:helicase-exonuclease AddAB subunit AddA [Lachnospiraceae bacterium]